MQKEGSVFPGMLEVETKFSIIQFASEMLVATHVGEDARSNFFEKAGQYLAQECASKTSPCGWEGLKGSESASPYSISKANSERFIAESS
mmetsp:Transcript_12134/g.24180  ORF Transcript_12134/g.24180 Transcript_12134/m.24180 type:complete len:90 (+) Transcript_12134:151-420(+)